MVGWEAEESPVSPPPPALSFSDPFQHLMGLGEGETLEIQRLGDSQPERAFRVLGKSSDSAGGRGFPGRRELAPTPGKRSNCLRAYCDPDCLQHLPCITLFTSGESEA